MPIDLTEHDLAAAEAAAENAARVRKLHRRETPKGDPRREADLKLAQERIQLAMRPLRSFMCGYAYGPQSETRANTRERVEAISLQLQAERRKLWKMRNR